MSRLKAKAESTCGEGRRREGGVVKEKEVRVDGGEKMAGWHTGLTRHVVAATATGPL
jgi:hypothetical protein